MSTHILKRTTEHQKKINLLLVDDKPENLLALESILDDLDCALFKALSGPEALRLVIKHDFALALVDVQMPEMNGFELAELIRGRQETRHLPIIFVTAISKEQRYVFKGYEVGAVDYLFKPIEPEILRSKVTVFIELYSQRRLLTKQAVELESKMKELEVEILERKRVETELQKALGTINKLAGGMAHELNNILAIMLGSVELAIDDLTDNAAVDTTVLKARLEQAYDTGIRGRDLVKEILVYSRSARHKLYPLKLDQVFRNIIHMIQPTLPPTVSIHHHFDPHCQAVLANQLHIEQIMINLCKNATDAMNDQKGNIEIRLEEIEYSTPPPQFPDLSEGRYVRFTVQDDGEGMSPDTRESIFTPFFTTKDVGKGTGLGLSVVYGIVQQYGGGITVDSELGKGTTFEIVLPVVQKVAEPETPIATFSKQAQEYHQRLLKKQHLLIVDDDAAGLRLPVIALEKLGHTVTTIQSSDKALDLFREDPKQFDLVITDLTMPEITGIEICQEVVNIRPDIPLILCIEAGEAVDTRTAEELGIRKFLRKPLTVRQVVQAIREIL